MKSKTFIITDSVTPENALLIPIEIRGKPFAFAHWTMVGRERRAVVVVEGKVWTVPVWAMIEA